MKIYLAILFIIGSGILSVAAQEGAWRKMSDEELKQAVPERAPVLQENIETELRTASGIVDGKKKIFGVVIITAGYEADGKYTHFFQTEKKMTVGALELKPGAYIFGYQRLDSETLRVTFYRAQDGELVGALKAKVERKKGPIHSFLIAPPVDNKGQIYIGRFTFDYDLS